MGKLRSHLKDLFDTLGFNAKSQQVWVHLGVYNYRTLKAKQHQIDRGQFNGICTQQQNIMAHALVYFDRSMVKGDKNPGSQPQVSGGPGSGPHTPARRSRPKVNAQTTLLGLKRILLVAVLFLFPRRTSLLLVAGSIATAAAEQEEFNNTTVGKPSKQEFAGILVEEMFKDLVPGGGRIEDALAKTMERLIKSDQNSMDENHTGWLDELIDDLEDGEASQEFHMVDQALQNATGSKSLCTRGFKQRKHKPSCKSQDEEKLRIISDWMTKKLSQTNQNIEPKLSQLYEELEEETGIDEEEAEELVKQNPKIEKMIRDKFKQATSNARKKEARVISDVMIDAVLNAGKHHANPAETIKKLGLDPYLAEGALNSLGKGQKKRIKKVLRKAELELEEQISKAEIKYANHTYFDTVYVNETDGSRRLRFLPNPSSVSFQDQIDAVKQETYQRRLKRPVLPEDTSEIKRLLTDHVQEVRAGVQGLRRKLRDKYGPGCPFGNVIVEQLGKEVLLCRKVDEGQCILAGGIWDETPEKKTRFCSFPPTKFVVVAKDFVQVYSSLSSAKDKLKTFDHGSRLIVEVDAATGHVMSGSPEMVAGEKQSSENGFHKYWHNKEDMKRMKNQAEIFLLGKAVESKEEKKSGGEDTDENGHEVAKSIFEQLDANHDGKLVMEELESFGQNHSFDAPLTDLLHEKAVESEGSKTSGGEGAAVGKAVESEVLHEKTVESEGKKTSGGEGAAVGKAVKSEVLHGKTVESEGKKTSGGEGAAVGKAVEAKDEKKSEREDTDESAKSVLLPMGEAKPTKKLGTVFASKNKGTRWIADSMSDLSIAVDNLSTIVEALLKALDPLGLIIKVIKWVVNMLDHLTNLVSLAMRALNMISAAVGTAGLASAGVITGIVASINGVLLPVEGWLQGASKTVSAFSTQIAVFWESTVGLAKNMIAQFKSYTSPVLKYTAAGAEVVAQIQANKCIRGISKKLSEQAFKIDLLGGIEAAADGLRKYVQEFQEGVKLLMDSLLSKPFAFFQKALDIYKGVLESLDLLLTDPLQLLKNLMTMKVDIPWYHTPYKKKQFGPSKCPQGYAPGKLDKKSCWEQNTHEFERIKLSVPPKMTYTCKSKNLERHVIDLQFECKNNGYSRDKRGYETGCHNECRGEGFFRICWPKCHVRCPGGYSVGFPDALHCYKNCDGGYTTIGDRCWKSDCPSGLEPSLLKNSCIKKYKRPQKKLAPICDMYSLDPGHGYDLHWLTGHCSQGCKNGEDQVGQICFPKSKLLTIDMGKIKEAFDVIYDYIKNSPLVKTIAKAIADAIYPHVKKVYDVIKGAFEEVTGIDLPDFPEASKDMLNFDFWIESAAKSFGKPPDLLKFARVPLKGIEKIMGSIDPNGGNIASCGAELDCIVEHMGLGDLDLIVDAIPLQLDLANEVKSVLPQFIKDIKCARWGVQSVPLQRLLKDTLKFSFDGVDSCNLNIDYCEMIDLTSVQKALEVMKKKFEPTLKRINEYVKKSGRRLTEGVFHQEFISLLSFSVGLTGLSAGTGHNPMSMGKLEWRKVIDFTEELSEAVDTTVETVKDQAVNIASGIAGTALGGLGDSAVDIAGTVINVGADLGAKALKSLNQPFAFQINVDPAMFCEMGIIMSHGEPSFGIKFGAKFNARVGAQAGFSALMVESIRISTELTNCDKSPEYKISDDAGSVCRNILNKKPPENCDLKGMRRLHGEMGWPFEEDKSKRKSAGACIQYWFNEDQRVKKEMFEVAVKAAAESAQKLFDDAKAIAVESTPELFGDNLDFDSAMELVNLDFNWVGTLMSRRSAQKIRNNVAEMPWENLSDKIKFSIGLNFGGDSPAFHMAPNCAFVAGAFTCDLGVHFNPQKMIDEGMLNIKNLALDEAEKLLDGTGGGGVMDWGTTKTMILEQLSKINAQAFVEAEFSHVVDPVALLNNLAGEEGGDGRRLIIDASINGTLYIPDLT